METITDYALEAARGAGADYADARLVNQRFERIETKGSTVSGLSKGDTEGLGIRVLAFGGWGFASTQNLSRSAVAQTARRACELAAASGLCIEDPITLVPETPYRASWVSPHLIDPFTVSLEDKLGILVDCASSMMKVKGISLATGLLNFVREEKQFASTEGARINQTFVRSGCCIEAHATNEDERQRRSYPKHMGQHELAGFEMVQRWDLPGNAERIASEAVALLSAPQCASGKSDVILGASQVGLQVHESCGHPSELDRALGHEINFAGGSFMTPDKLHGLQYGSDLVNLVADATQPGALGSFGFDDEGVEAQCVYLVRDGLFSGYLSSRDTAERIGLTRSGGAMRAESWNRAPIIRMTNISLLPGHSGSLDDLVGDTEDGLLMETNKSWSIDSMRYNFQFSTEIAWEIKNGKLGKIVKNPSYSGITPEFWGSCDAICGEDEWINWGEPNCGKGQPMQVMWTGHGASPARFRSVDVGVACT